MKSILLPNEGMQDFVPLYPVFDLIQNGIAITDQSSNFIYANPAYCQITGYSLDEVIGNNPGMSRSGYHDEHFYKKLWESLKQEGAWEGEIWNRNKTGSLYPVKLSITKVQFKLNYKIYYLAIFNDVSCIKAKDTEQINLSLHDFLTQLPNGLFLQEYFKRMLSYQNVANKIGVILIDVKDFKIINDQYGHVAGDLLLKFLAKKLLNILQPDDFLAKVVGDKFIIIIPHVQSDLAFNPYIARIKEIFIDPFNIDEIDIYADCYVGKCIYPDDAKSFAEVMKQAEKSIANAKTK